MSVQLTSYGQGVLWPTIIVSSHRTRTQLSNTYPVHFVCWSYIIDVHLNITTFTRIRIIYAKIREKRKKIDQNKQKKTIDSKLATSINKITIDSVIKNVQDVSYYANLQTQEKKIDWEMKQIESKRNNNTSFNHFILSNLSIVVKD